MNREQVTKRQLNWWEHYPLHKVWCNDVFPLVPRFEYRPGDEWNANNCSLHWLIFHIWTLEHFAFNAEINIGSNSITIGFIIPYFRIFIGFHHVWQWAWLNKLSRFLRRKPALKNEKGEYN